MKCPIDRTILKERERYSSGALHCETCNGSWFTKNELKKFLKTFKVQKTDWLVQSQISPASSQEPLLCPADQRHRLYTVEYEGVYADVCLKHESIWIDVTNLKHLIKVYENETLGESLLGEDTARVVRAFFPKTRGLTSWWITFLLLASTGAILVGRSDKILLYFFYGFIVWWAGRLFLKRERQRRKERFSGAEDPKQ